ncbi:hypothetical protein AB0H28_07605 [Micromonospora sp. NPDC050980]|uniref:hypothetical protein n=1 Tax=Micromonospora sp. NPDC050980 TaxID=3155161 RepID=UPI003402E93D
MTTASAAATPPRRQRAVPPDGRLRRATAALLLGLSLTACADGPTGTDAAHPLGASGSSTRPGTVDDPVDDCALLTDAEVTAVIGAHGGGVAGADGCVWENPDTAHSITLSVGLTGTAASGSLPAPDPVLGTPEPGPDGIRFVVGAAEFVAGDRVCTLRVVTSVTDDRDRPTMVRLARSVRDRLTSGVR